MWGPGEHPAGARQWAEAGTAGIADRGCLRVVRQQDEAALAAVVVVVVVAEVVAAVAEVVVVMAGGRAGERLSCSSRCALAGVKGKAPAAVAAATAKGLVRDVLSSGSINVGGAQAGK